MNVEGISEIGRELKVSELRPQTIVWLDKEGHDTIASVRVVAVGKAYVHFSAGAAGIEFLAERSGPDLESVTDDTHVPMKMYEYLGEP